MIVYLFNILILTLANIWPGRSTDVDPAAAKRKRVCIVGALGWIILSGLRGISVGDDTEAYMLAFERISRSSWMSVLNPLYARYIDNEFIKDPGYNLLQKCFQIFFDNYQLFLIFIAIVFTISMAKWIYKYSEDAYISFMIYSSLFYSFFAITGHRQTIATAFVVFMGYELVRQRKLVKFLLLVLLMSTIHKSALCVIPFYWISQLKNNRATLTLWWGAIAASFIFRYQLLAALQFLVGYESYQDFEGAGAHTFTAILIFVTLVATFCYFRIREKAKETFEPAMNAMFLACIFSPLLLINPSMMRVVQYFSLYVMLIMPEIKIAFRKFNPSLITASFALILTFKVIANNPHYVFFWQEQFALR